jgi:hypothetical protein
MIIKVFPDKEKAKSIFELVKQRENYVKTSSFEGFPTGKAENYYEILKELATILLLLNGIKTTGDNAHKELFDELFERKLISEEERTIVQDLRIKRNYSMYEGKQVKEIYLKNNENKINDIISKLKEEIQDRLR